MMRPDLHTHSSYSDGVLCPQLLVEEAVREGVTLLAITDHDTMSGCDTLRGRELPVTLIPGVELSIGDMRCLHLLGYGLGDAPALRQRIQTLAEHRVSRARQMLDKLEQLDRETLDTFGAWLADHHLQAIATRVSTGEECTLIIEDGAVEEPKAVPAWTPGQF